MFTVKLSTTGDEAEADSASAILFAAKTLVDDASTHYGAGRLHRAGLLVFQDGRYDGLMTTKARDGDLS